MRRRAFVFGADMVIKPHHETFTRISDQGYYVITQRRDGNIHSIRLTPDQMRHVISDMEQELKKEAKWFTEVHDGSIK
jgi:hypothetical protein